MYVATIPNRNSRPAILLRESYRENGKVKNRTLKNLSDWPAERVELLRAALRGDGLAPAGEGMEIERALLHGHVLAALGTARAIELDALLPRGKERRHQLALALIVARVLAPSAKLATARALDPATASHALGATLELGPVKVKELYATLDGLGKHQEGIERRLARRHLGSGTLVLYDVTSSYLEGRHCPLARRGYSRDGKKGKLQIVFGLICNAAGCPVAVEVFEGHCGDPATLSAQLDKLKRRFGLRRMVLVGDRGLITSARIDEDLRPAGFDWMTALRAPAIAKLAGVASAFVGWSAAFAPSRAAAGRAAGPVPGRSSATGSSCAPGLGVRRGPGSGAALCGDQGGGRPRGPSAGGPPDADGAVAQRDGRRHRQCTPSGAALRGASRLSLALRWRRGQREDAGRLPDRCRVGRGDPKPLSKFTHADRRPGLAVDRLAPHLVRRDAEFTIRPVTTQLAHDVDRASPVVRRIAAGLDPGYPQFRMAAANPMDDHDRLIGLLVQIDHGFLDQQVGQPLFRPGIPRRCIPCHRQIVRKPHQRRGTDLGT